MKKVLLTISLFALVFMASAQQDEDAFKKFKVFDPSKVAQKLFDATAIKKNEFIWKPSYAELFSFNYFISYDGFCHTSLDTAFDIKEAGVSYMLVIYKTFKYESKSVVQDCHGCAPMLSVALFRLEPDRSFYLENFKKDFKAYGGFGLRGPLRIEKISDEHNAIVTINGYMGQGQYNETTSYYSVLYPEFLTCLIDFESENSNNNTGAITTSVLKFIPGKKGEMYALQYTNSVNGKVSPIKPKYVFSPELRHYVKSK